MSRYLLDTELLLWWLTGDRRLPAWGAAMLQLPGTSVLVSHASLWELAEKQGAGWFRLASGLGLADLVREVNRLGLRWLAVEPHHLQALSRLPDEPHPYDPFDRLLVAQARSEPLILVSGDPAMKRYGATVLLLHA
jgi:PIN domain nuclease of toxin-antitoxin system